MKLLREPLLHFLLIGAAIYVIYAVAGREDATDARETITVTAGQINWLKDSWQKRWNRAPTPDELEGLINQHVRETVLYREAMAMGLDKEDVVIRRRLGQKLEFLFQDLADAVPPTDEDLQAYFATHQQRYRDPEVLTFTHVFFDPDRRGDRTLDDAEKARAALMAQADPTAGTDGFGDQFMLQRYYPDRSEPEIAKLFGQPFAQSVFALEVDQWHGPVLSGYGTHLVYVHDRSQPPPPDFELARDRVREDWQTEKRQQVNDEFVASLLSRYEIIIEDAPAEEDAGSG